MESIASPGNLMMDELLSELILVEECVAYADDLLIFVEGNSRLGLKQRGTMYIGIINARYLKLGVVVSTLKTNATLHQRIFRRLPLVKQKWS